MKIPHLLGLSWTMLPGILALAAQIDAQIDAQTGAQRPAMPPLGMVYFVASPILGIGSAGLAGVQNAFYGPPAHSVIVGLGLFIDFLGHSHARRGLGQFFIYGA